MYIMEAEMEKQQESEKPREKRSMRRSSILKMPKSRTPFEEIDTEVCSPDMNSSKPVRRVSFASSNFIKPFVADPEKNTIWDTTYEETVNHTNSTQSSQEQNGCTKLGATTFSDHPLNITILCEKSMELTSVIDKENLPILPKNKVSSIVDYAKQLSSKCNNMQTDANATKLLSQSMEFTCCNLNILKQNVENQIEEHHTVFQEADMDLTGSVDETVKTEIDFTYQAPETNLTKINYTMEFNCQTPQGSSTKIGEEMEFTCHVPLNNLSKINDAMEFACQIPENKLTQVNDTMQLTLHEHLVKVTEKTEFSNQVPQMSDTMEFTCQVPQKDLAQKRDTMESRCQVSQKDLTKISDNMEFTCQILQDDLTAKTEIQQNITNIKHDVEIACQSLSSNLVNIDTTRSEIPMEMSYGISEEHLIHSNYNKKSFGQMESPNKLSSGSDRKENCQQSDTLTNQPLNALKENVSRVDGDRSRIQNYIKSDEILSKAELLSEKVLREEDLTRTGRDISEVMDHKINKSDILRDDSTETKMTENKISTHESDSDMEISSHKSYSDMEIDQTMSMKSTTEKEVEGKITSSNNTRSFIRNENVTLEEKPEKMTEKTEHLSTTLLKVPSPTSAKKSQLSTTFSKPKLPLCPKISEDVASPVPKSPRITQIPVWKNSSLLQTPEKFQPEFFESNLVCSAERQPKTKVTVPAPHFKHELSDFKTPEPSFNINLTNISSGVDDDDDDTQQLLRFQFSKSIMTPNLPGKDEETAGEKSGNNSLSFIDIPRSGKMSNINDTYVLKKKKDKSKSCQLEITTTNEDADGSIGIIPDACLGSLDLVNRVDCPHENNDHLVKSVLRECDKDFVNKSIKRKKVEDFRVKEYDYKIRRISELSHLLQNIQEKRDKIIHLLENFKFPQIPIPQKFTIKENSSDTFSFKEATEEISVTLPSIEDNIRKHQESAQNCWKLEMIDDDFYHFSTLFGTLVFAVRLDPESTKVLQLQTGSKLAANSLPIARYILKVYLEKLRDDHITSAIGDNYNVLSLLDYVKMTMLRLHQFQRDFMLCNKIAMEQDFVVKYKILNVPLTLSCEILVDISDIENLKFERDFRIIAQIGTMSESEIKNLANNCPKGLDFVVAFHKNIQEFLRTKEKQKGFEKTCQLCKD